MTWWQVRADLGSGGRVLFGVRAEDRETAWDKMDSLLDGLREVALVEVLEIPPPGERPIV